VENRYVVELLAVTLILNLTRCSDGPLGPAEAQWYCVTPFDFPVRAITDIPGGNGVFLCGSDTYGPGFISIDDAGGYRAFINKFDGHVFEEVYRLENDSPIGLNDVRSLYQAGEAIGWAGGYREKEPGIFDPLLVRYAGEAWKEVDIGSRGVGAINRVHPISAQACWLITSITHEYEVGEYVIRYDAGRLRFLGTIRPFRGSAYDEGNDILYVGAFSSEPRNELLIYDGQTERWFAERVDHGLFGYEVESIKPAYAAGNDLYLLADLGITGNFQAIIKRTGAPGLGRYEFQFLSNESGYVFRIDKVVFKATDGEGLAVGDKTSLIFKGGAWRPEELPYYLNIGSIVADGESGYWATGSNEGLSRSELLFHP
jgi:hypothetical protein